MNNPIRLRRGSALVWLTMKGPRAVGKRDTVAIRRDADHAGVDTARKQVAQSGAAVALEAGRRRSQLAMEAETRVPGGKIYFGCETFWPNHHYHAKLWGW